MSIKKLFNTLAIGTIITTFSVSALPKSLVFVANFNKGDLSAWKQTQGGFQACCNYSINIVNSPTRAGDRIAKFTLNKRDAIEQNVRRAELRSLNFIPPNSEAWYGFRNYIPNNWVADQRSYDIVSQWITRPDSNLGESQQNSDFRSPPLALMITGKNWSIHRRWDPNKITRNNKPGAGGGKETISLGAYQTDVWTDWVFHVKWSYKSDGLVEVWQNGKLVVKKTGPNIYNDEGGSALKVGIYKPQWAVRPELSVATQRVIYFDEIRIGNAQASYEIVAP